MAWSLVQTNNIETGSTVSSLNLAFSSAIAAGDLLVVAVQALTDSASTHVSAVTVTDTSGNTYHPACSIFNDGNLADPVATLFYAFNSASAGAGTNTVTASWNQPLSRVGVIISQWHSSLASVTSDPIDNGNGNTTVAGTSLSVSLTASQSGDLAIADFVNWNGGVQTPTPGGGYTQAVLTGGGLVLLEYNLSAASGSVSASASVGSSTALVIVAALFKEPGLAPAVSASTLLTQRRAPGYPPSGPLPGIPTLGRGILRSPPTPPPARNPYLNLRTQQRAPGFPPGAPIPGIPLLGVGILKRDVPIPLGRNQPAPPLRTQERAKGFPRRAPLPGIPQLGVGILQASPPAATSVNAAIAQNLGGLVQAATAAQTIPASAAQRLGGLVQAAAAKETFATSVAQRLGGLVQAASAAETFSTSIAQRLGGLRQSATSASGLAATIAQRLGGLVQAASAAQSIATSIAQRLGGLRQSASASTGTTSGPMVQYIGEQLLTAQSLDEGTLIDLATGEALLTTQELGESLLSMQATGERATMVQVLGEQS